MKNKFFALLLASALSFGMCVGCAPTTPEPETPPVIPSPEIPPAVPVEYELIKVEGCKGIFEVNESFVINNVKFTLKDKNSSNTKIVDLTMDMIKTVPDMTTEGQKTITIIYEGNEYSFVITVVDSYKKIVDKLLNYLQSYEKGSTESLNVNVDINLVSKFLKDFATTDEEQNYTLNKSDITSIEGILPNQKAFLEKIYEALADSLTESGLNISKEQIIDTNSNTFAISQDKIIESAIENIATKTMEDALFDALLPGSIDETAEMLSKEFAEMFSIETNTKAIFKNLLLEMKQRNVGGMKASASDLLEIMQQDADLDSNSNKMAFATALKTFVEDDSENLIYNLAINCFDALNLKIYDKNGNDITTSYSITKKYSTFRTQIGLMAKGYDNFLNGKSSVYVLMETTKLAYSNMATVCEYFEEKEYTFIEGFNSHILKYNVELINFRLNMMDNLAKLSIEKTTVLKVEKVLFALVGQFVSVNTKSNIETNSESEEEYNEYDYIEESIETIKKLSAYLNAIFAKDREEFNKFISELTEDEKYYEYYTETGESRFLTRLLEKTCLEENYTNKEFYADYYEANEKITLFLDGIATKLEKSELETIDVVDAFAQYAFDCLSLAEKYPEEEFDVASITIVASMHSKFENNKERLQFIINNIGFNVYEEIAIYLTNMFVIDDDMVRESIEDVVEENLNYILNNDEISEFNMFAEVMDIIIAYKDQELTECFREEKSVIVNAVKDLAISIDNVVVTGNSDNLVECIKTNLPEFTKFIQNVELKTILNFLAESGFNIDVITSGTLNNEQVAPIIKDVVSTYVYNLLVDYGVEPTDANYELVKENFTNAVYESMLDEETGEYYWSNLKTEVIIEEFYNTLNLLEIEYNADLKNIIKECLKSEGNVVDNLKNYLLDDEKRAVVVDYIVNYTTGPEMTDVHIEDVRTFFDGMLLDLVNNEATPEKIYDEYFALLKSMSIEENVAYIEGLDVAIKGLYEILNGNIENAQTLIKEFRDEYENSEVVIPLEIDFILNVLDYSFEDGFNFETIADDILNDETMSEYVKYFLYSSTVKFFSKVTGTNDDYNYDQIMENFVEPIYSSMFDEASGKYSWLNLKREVVVEKVYDTLEALDYAYNTTIKDLTMACLNSDGTFVENFKNYLKQDNNRKNITEYIVEILTEGTETTELQKLNVETFIDEMLSDIANDTLSAEKIYNEYIEVTKSNVGEEYEIFIDRMDLTIKSLYELSQGNVGKVKSLLEEFRETYPNSAEVIPGELDLILDLATYEAESTMDMVARALYYKDCHDACISALTALMVNLHPELADDDKCDIVRIYFAETIVDEIIKSKELSAETVAKIYFSTIEKLNEEFASEIAYNEMLADFVTTMLKFNEDGTIIENAEVNFKEFLSNNKDAIVPIFANMLVSTVDESVVNSARADAEEIFDNLIDIAISGEYEETEIVEQITQFCETYYTEDVQTKIYSMSALIVILAGNKDIDYNELFAFVELPEGVNIDYNVLIEKLMDETNWKDCVKISQLEYTINENSAKDTYVGQTYYMTLDINFDAEIASLKGSIQVKIDIK